MKIAVQKNHLVGQILYRRLVPSIKTASLAPSKYGSSLAISQRSGNVWLINSTAGFVLSSEMVCVGETVLYDTISLTAYDHGTPELSESIDFYIYVTDQNNHAPVIAAPAEVTVEEMSPAGTVVATIDVSDADPCNPNNLFALTAVGEFAEYFRVWNGKLLISDTGLDYEHVGPNVTVTLKALDRGVTPLETTHSIRVVITDKNDEDPAIVVENLTNAFAEDIAMDEMVAYVTVTDPDSTAMLNIDLNCECKKGLQTRLCSPFRLLPNSVTNRNINDFIFVNHVIDFEEESDILCVLQVADQNGGTEQVVSVELAFQISNVNDNIPIFTSPTYRYSVAENVLVGQLIGTVTAVDADVGDEVLYSISDNDYLQVDIISGEVKIKQTFDYERGFHI